MRFGFRRPSFKKRFAARTSWKRAVRHRLGLNAPRGWGWLTNPKKAAYNRVYRRTTFGVDDLFKTRRASRSGGCLLLIFVIMIGPVIAIGIWQAMR